MLLKMYKHITIDLRCLHRSLSKIQEMIKYQQSYFNIEL